LTGNQPEYIPYLIDIECLNLKLPGRLKTAVLAKANPDKPETKKQSRKQEKEYYFVLSNFRVFVVKKITTKESGSNEAINAKPLRRKNPGGFSA
jgi:hypothetical protein